MLKKALVALAAIGLVSSASASVLTMQFDNAGTFTGTGPTGSITATFTDVGAGQVQLTITSNLAGTEFVLPGDGFYFNLNPTMDPTLMSFATLFGPTTTLLTGVDSFKPDGDGLMDLELVFSPSNLKAFQGGGTASYLFSMAGLDVSDFFFDSFCGRGCGTGAHLAAVHIGNTGVDGSSSAWVGPEQTCVDCTPTPRDVPEPMSLALVGAGLFGLAMTRKRKMIENDK